MSTRTMTIVGLLAMVISGLLLMGISSSGEPFTYSGKVVSIDRDAQVLTLQAGPNDELMFKWDNKAEITKCNVPVTFNDINVGDMVSLQYYQRSNGNYIAETMSFVPAGKHC